MQVKTSDMLFFCGYMVKYIETLVVLPWHFKTEINMLKILERGIWRFDPSTSCKLDKI